MSNRGNGNVVKRLYNIAIDDILNSRVRKFFFWNF